MRNPLSWSGDGYHAGVSEPIIRRFVLASLQRDRPRSVLDLGCGVGVYGRLMRMHLYPCPYLIGVDAWQPYLESDFASLYDELICANLFDVVNGKRRLWYECVLCMDVVEHFERGAARALLDWLLEQPLAYMSTPLFDYPQGAVGGNEMERHRCYFTMDELVSMGWPPLGKVEIAKDKWIGVFRNERWHA